MFFHSYSDLLFICLFNLTQTCLKNGGHSLVEKKKALKTVFIFNWRGEMATENGLPTSPLGGSMIFFLLACGLWHTVFGNHFYELKYIFSVIITLFYAVKWVWRKCPVS